MVQEPSLEGHRGTSRRGRREAASAEPLRRREKGTLQKLGAVHIAGTQPRRAEWPGSLQLSVCIECSLRATLEPPLRPGRPLPVPLPSYREDARPCYFKFFCGVPPPNLAGGCYLHACKERTEKLCQGPSVEKRCPQGLNPQIRPNIKSERKDLWNSGYFWSCKVQIIFIFFFFLG